MSKWKEIGAAIVRAIVYILFGVTLPSDVPPVENHQGESEVSYAKENVSQAGEKAVP